jgi:hypothetical protein
MFKNWDVRIGALFSILGLGGEIANALNIANTTIGRWLIVAGLIVTQLRAKSVAVTGTGTGAARVADVSNVPINTNPNR